jgi:hypothetical protein
MECEPANPVVFEASPGEEVDHSCSGTNTAIGGETTSAGVWRFEGPEVLTIAGEEVDTLHFHGDRTISGAQDGSELTDAWFGPDGLLLRYERDIEVRSDSPIGTITYTESGWFELTELEPQR